MVTHQINLPARLRSIVTVTACFVMPTFPHAVPAAELSGAVTLTSEYIYRGLQMTDGNPALQLGVDYEHDSGLFAGAWTSTADSSSPLGRRDVELDYYAGFHFAPDAPVSAILTLLRYTYPGQTTLRSYDYSELLASLIWREQYSLEYGYAHDLYGFDANARHWELGAEWPLRNAWVIGAALGRNDMSDGGVSPYLHWNLGASARFARLTVDLRWYDNEAVNGFAARYAAGSQFVLSVSAAF